MDFLLSFLFLPKEIFKFPLLESIKNFKGLSNKFHIAFQRIKTHICDRKIDFGCPGYRFLCFDMFILQNYHVDCLTN